MARHKGSISHTNLQRDKVVLDLFRKAKSRVSWPADTMTICEAAASLPVDRFYISQDAAVCYVRRRYYHDKVTVYRSHYRQQLYEALYDAFTIAVGRPENRYRPLPDIVINILQSPAPCLGLAPFQIYLAVLRLKKKKQDD